MQFSTYIHGAHMMNLNFGDPRTFHLVPPSCQNSNLSNTLVYDQILAKLICFVIKCFLFSKIRARRLQLVHI